MEVLPIKFNYYKNIKFSGNSCFSDENWIILKNELTRDSKYGFDENVVVRTNCVPTFNKPHFEYTDYLKLSPKERLIISIFNRKGTNHSDTFDNRKDISIKKDAERIFNYATKTKEYFDNKYKNGYKLVGIGNSPAPIIETMQLLGANAVTLPFSRVQIEASPDSRDFPYEHWVAEGDGGKFFPNSYYGHWEKCKAEDWKEYFKYYGVHKDFTRNTGKALIFTDYVCDGWTKKYIEAILEGIGFDKNYEFVETEQLLPHNVGFKIDFSVFRCLDNSSFKHYAKMESPRHCFRKVDILKHPEYIPSLPEKLKSKFFRCALYDLLAIK